MTTGQAALAELGCRPIVYSLKTGHRDMPLFVALASVEGGEGEVILDWWSDVPMIATSNSETEAVELLADRVSRLVGYARGECVSDLYRASARGRWLRIARRWLSWR